MAKAKPFATEVVQTAFAVDRDLGTMFSLPQEWTNWSSQETGDNERTVTITTKYYTLAVDLVKAGEDWIPIYARFLRSSFNDTTRDLLGLVNLQFACIRTITRPRALHYYHQGRWIPEMRGISTHLEKWLIRLAVQHIESLPPNFQTSPAIRLDLARAYYSNFSAYPIYIPPVGYTVTIPLAGYQRSHRYEVEVGLDRGTFWVIRNHLRYDMYHVWHGQEPPETDLGPRLLERSLAFLPISEALRQVTRAGDIIEIVNALRQEFSHDPLAIMEALMVLATTMPAPKDLESLFRIPLPLIIDPQQGPWPAFKLPPVIVAMTQARWIPEYDAVPDGLVVKVAADAY